MSSESSGRPLFQDPLIETNSERASRPVIWKARRLGGAFGISSNLLFSGSRGNASGAQQEEGTVGFTKHWGLQIGPYMHELNTDEGKNRHLMIRRLKGAQIWLPCMKERVLGYTTLTDKEIDAHGI
jgi:hypothetical protein